MSADKKYILVVEDNPMAAKMAKIFLESAGCQVDHAEDGDKAIEMAINNSYDGICMDIGMPTVNGVDACIEIRKHEVEHSLSQVPIIAVTGNNSPEEVPNYIKAGMQAVIAKPMTKEKTEYFLSFCKK